MTKLTRPTMFVELINHPNKKKVKINKEDFDPELHKQARHPLKETSEEDSGEKKKTTKKKETTPEGEGGS